MRPSGALFESGLSAALRPLWKVNNMRVLHVGKFFHPYRGGIENFLLDLAVELKRNGVASSILAHHERPLKRTQKENLDGLETCRTFSLGQILYAPIAPSFGHHLSEAIRCSNPHLLHIHVPNVSAFFVLTGQKRPPYIVHWHADVVPSIIDRRLRLFYPPYSLFEKALLRNAEAIIVTSRAYLDTSRALFPFRHKCHVVPLGLDPARFHCIERGESAIAPEPSLGRFTILSVGRFTYYKGFQYLVEAAQHLPEARFILVGDGPLRKGLIERVMLHGLEDRVLLPGQVSDRELHALMAGCDVFCLPSIERTEAFGLVLLEAMAFGKALVTTDIEGSGVNWVNRNGTTGLVVKPMDSQALADAIKRLATEPQMRKKMGDNAKKRFTELFHIRNVARDVIGIYSTCQTSPIRGL
jgi:glycosyltransferase involved in cell wall biosynthesis